MSKDDNVIPLRPTPNHFTDQEFASSLFDYAVQGMKDEAARLLNAETILNDRPLPDRVERELEQLEQVGLESYIDCNGKRCYRPAGAGLRQRQLNRIRENYEYRAHVEAVYRELTERRLTEIDPEWRDHYKTFEAAERAYWEELQVKTTGLGHPFEPPQ
jgi:hypothetical protein